MKRFALLFILGLLIDILLVGCQVGGEFNGSPTNTPFSAMTIIPLTVTVVPPQSSPAPTVAPTVMATETAVSTPNPFPPPPTYQYTHDAPSEEQSADAIQAANELENWLSNAWHNQIPAEKVAQALLAAEWIDENGWQMADVNGDGDDEWLLTIYFLPADYQWARGGDFWVFGEDGLLFQFFPYEDYFSLTATPTFDDFAPQMIGVGDFSGDGVADLYLQTGGCGAHTCWGNYYALSFVNGRLQNVIQYPEKVDQWGRSILFYRTSFESRLLSIPMTYETYQVADANSDGLLDLTLSGGAAGSAGSGIQRERTEIWGWHGSGIGLIDLKWHHTTWQMHILWEAIDQYDMGNFVESTTLFIQVIEDETLETAEITEDNPIRMAQFSAFRLALIGYKQNQPQMVNQWTTWLVDKYPDTPITEAALILQDAFASDANSADACTAATDKLLTQPETEVADLLPYEFGYGNPQFSIEDFCPELSSN